MKVEPGQTEQTKNGWAKMRQVCAAMAINLKDAQSDECVSKAQAHILCVGQPLARPKQKEPSHRSAGWATANFAQDAGVQGITCGAQDRLKNVLVLDVIRVTFVISS